jgi:uncharacterized protein (DUF4415 family)
MQAKTGSALPPGMSAEEWARFNEKTDEEIESAVAVDPDAAPLLTEQWFTAAQRAAPAELTKGKVAVSIRLDRDVIDHFKSRGGPYQTAINAVLREFMRAEQLARGRR